MTVIDLPRTATLQRLALLDEQIAQTRAALSGAWGDVAAAHLVTLERAQAELLDLVATNGTGA